ncbi:MAG: general secretion pathway protein GspB [Proteobacteria bacterium]|nr:general secretion pathway protein GspB [Pseudomonadota bacterium]
MSFILDALKKSETERQQQGSAEFAAIPTNPGSVSLPRWLWIVGLLLAVNLAVLIVLLLLPDSPPTQSGTLSSASQATPQQQLQPSFTDQVAAASQNLPDKQDEPATARVPDQHPAVRPVLISQNPSAIPSGEIYPTVQEVRASGSLDLPELHLDIHVYSDVPKDRFVFINMTKLREGSQLEEGPIIVEITRDGVILGHQGLSFLLPRE